MVRLHKLSIGDVFCVDANKWIKQYGDVMFPYAYVESTDGTSIKLELMGIEKIKTKRHWWQFWRLKKKCYRFRVIAVA